MSKMLLAYLTFDGREIIEKTRSIRESQIEMPDGDHPYTDDSVWRDSRRKEDPLVIIRQRINAPYGAKLVNKDIKGVLFEIDLAEKALKRPSESKMWQRKFGAAVDWFIEKGFFFMILAVIIYVVIASLIGGH